MYDKSFANSLRGGDVTNFAKNCAMLSLTAGAALLILVGEAFGETTKLQQLPTTPEGNYAVAQRFANCSGHFAFAAFLANRNGLSDAAQAFGDMQRGWKLAGMFFLAESMSKGRLSETGKTFDYLVESKVTIMKAKFELDPRGSNQEFQGQYQEKCIPWVETQKKILELIRRSA